MRIKPPEADNYQADSKKKKKMESHCACVCVHVCARACMAFSCQSLPVSRERTIMKPVGLPLSPHRSRWDTVGSAASKEDKRHAKAAQQKQTDVGRCRTYLASAARSSPCSSPGDDDNTWKMWNDGGELSGQIAAGNLLVFPRRRFQTHCSHRKRRQDLKILSYCYCDVFSWRRGADGTVCIKRARTNLKAKLQ